MIASSLSLLANHLWQSTFFAALVALLTLSFKRNRAAARYGLWLAASAKFLVPFALLVNIGSEFKYQPVSSLAQPRLPIVMEEISQPFTPPTAKPVPSSAPARRYTPLVL